MRELLICCSPADLEAVREVAAWLRRSAEFQIVVDDSDAESVAAKGADGLDSASAILPLLSPDSVPHEGGRARGGDKLRAASRRCVCPRARPG